MYSMANTVRNLGLSPVHGADSPLRSEITLETEIASNDVNGKTNVQSKDISEDNVKLWPSANGPMTRTGV